MASPIQSNALLEAALAYATRGWRVIPLWWPMQTGDTPVCACPRGGDCGRSGHNAGKHPILDDWTTVGTINPDTISKWWHAWPSANIGILTGGGLVNLDIDPRNYGHVSLKELQTTYEELPETVMAQTGGGGEHRLFTTTTDLPSVKLAPGIDFLADSHHQFVAVPSLHHSGARYAWELSSDPEDISLAPLPAWVAALVTSTAIEYAAASAILPVHLPHTDDLGILNISPRMKERIRAGVPQGERSGALWSVMKTLIRAGYDDATIAGIVLDPANGISEKPLEQKNSRSPRYWEMTRGWVAKEIGRARTKPDTPWTPSTPDDPFGTGLPTIPNMNGAASSKTLHASRLSSRIAIPIIITMDSVIAQPTEWLWWPYLAIGTLAMLDGDPGIGKSLLTSQLAASLSRGWPLPNQQGVPEGHAAPAHSLFMAREDSLTFTVKKRLDELQADASKIHYLTGWRGAEDEEYAFTLADMDVLAKGLELHRPRLVVLDPIQGYLGAKVDINRANETRPLLDKLSSVAEAYGCTILCVRHPAKASGQGGGKAMLRGLGSVDFIGAARTGLFVEQHPFEHDLALMAMSKSNLGPKGRTHIFSKAAGIFSWAGVTRMDAEILAGSGRGPDPRAFLEAYLWLEKRLEGGIPVPATDVEAQAEQEIDASVKILRRAKKALGVISKQESYGWTWKLSSLSLSPTTRPSDDTGSTGSTGSTGVSDVFKDYKPYREADAPIDAVTPEDPDDPVDPVLTRDAHDAGARESKIMPESKASRSSTLMAWDSCPQCQQTHWAPDTGAPLVCLACGYVTE